MKRTQMAMTFFAIILAVVAVAAATAVIVRNNLEHERAVSIEAANFAVSIEAAVKRCSRRGAEAYTITTDGEWTPISPSLAAVLVQSAKKRLADANLDFKVEYVPVTVRCEPDRL